MSKNFIPIEPLAMAVARQKGDGKNAYWYVRMYWKAPTNPKRIQITKELRGQPRERLKAKARGKRIWQEFKAASRLAIAQEKLDRQICG